MVPTRGSGNEINCSQQPDSGQLTRVQKWLKLFRPNLRLFHLPSLSPQKQSLVPMCLNFVLFKNTTAQKCFMSWRLRWLQPQKGAMTTSLLASFCSLNDCRSYRVNISLKFLSPFLNSLINQKYSVRAFTWILSDIFIKITSSSSRDRLFDNGKFDRHLPLLHYLFFSLQSCSVVSIELMSSTPVPDIFVT